MLLELHILLLIFLIMQYIVHFCMQYLFFLHFMLHNNGTRLIKKGAPYMVRLFSYLFAIAVAPLT
jgi:hypothetical protein